MTHLDCGRPDDSQREETSGVSDGRVLERVRHEEDEKYVKKAEAQAPQSLQSPFHVQLAPRKVEQRRHGEKVETNAGQQDDAVVEDFRQVDEDVVVRPTHDVENSQENGPEAMIGEHVSPVTQRHLPRKRIASQRCARERGVG